MEFDKLSGATGVAFVDVRGLEQQIRAQVTAFLFGGSGFVLFVLAHRAFRWRDCCTSRPILLRLLGFLVALHLTFGHFGLLCCPR